MGICVTQFDPKQVERCLVASPGYLPTLEGGCVVSVCAMQENVMIHIAPFFQS